MHFTRNIGGEVLLGPTALLAGAREGYHLGDLSARDLWEMGRRPEPGPSPRALAPGAGEIRHAVSRERFVAECRRFLPELRADDSVPAPAGVRAMALGEGGSLVDDFVVEATDRVLHVRNAPSPAATSSLALAAAIADRVDAVGPPR